MSRELWYICDECGRPIAEDRMFFECPTCSKKDEDGEYIKDIQHDFEDFESLGAEVKCVEEHHAGSKSCENEYYVFGQYFNKGGWHTPDIIKTGPDGIEIDKLTIEMVNADGFKVFNEIEYDGEVYYLEEDSTGKSSSFYVAKGDNLK